MSRLAKIVPTPKGTYSSSVTYNALDIVRYNQVSWMCKQDNTSNVTPAEGDYWMKLNQDGSGSEVTFTTQSGASATTYGCQIITINDTPYIIDGTVYMEQTQSVVVGTNTFTFTNAIIDTDSAIDAWASEYGIAPSDISLSSGSCAVQFECDNAGSLTCRIYIR